MKIPGYKEEVTSSTQQQGRQRMQRSMPPNMPVQMMQMFQRGEQRQQDQQKGPKREVKWLIAVDGDSPLKVVVTSQKGGTKVKRLSIN